MMSELLFVRIVCVAAAGALGALSRWGVSRGSQLLLGDQWPYGTIIVNAVGCLLFGFVAQWLREQPQPHDLVRLIVLTGFAGALTTFSTFAFDTYELAIAPADQSALVATLKVMANVAAHLLSGGIALLTGIALARAVT